MLLIGILRSGGELLYSITKFSKNIRKYDDVEENLDSWKHFSKFLVKYFGFCRI